MLNEVGVNVDTLLNVPYSSISQIYIFFLFQLTALDISIFLGVCTTSKLCKPVFII